MNERRPGMINAKVQLRNGETKRWGLSPSSLSPEMEEGSRLAEPKFVERS